MSKDRDPIEQLLQASASGAVHVVLHYLYLPTRHLAAEVAVELRAQGFKTEERIGADGTNWLVLARHNLVPSEAAITVARQVMEALTVARGGEYDGWEAEVQQQ